MIFSFNCVSIFCRCVYLSNSGIHHLMYFVVLQVKVMQRQLLLFHNATTAYFSGNKQGLENTMKEFHVKMANKDGGPSFLEQK